MGSRRAGRSSAGKRSRIAATSLAPAACVRAAFLLAPLLLAAPSAHATATQPRVIELFTSQSCPKCPPADGLIGTLAHEPGTIALSFSVDTWDYSGWKDTLASPAFTARQHDYASARGDGRVFTPQAVINGRNALPGADRDAILRDLATDVPAPVPISIAEKNGVLQVHVGGAEGRSATGPVGVYVVRAARSRTVAIGRGRNSGRSITYTNVVRAIQKLGEWHGAPLDLHMIELKSDDEGYVVLVQKDPPGRPGPILAAAKTDGL